jgi:SAM-dependent methyltransferase
MAGERNRLRTTFDEAASLYDEVRPGYPGELFDDVVSLSGIPAGGRILEIGCGTGQATVPFARRGYRILCIELGENMAAVARRNLEGYPQAEVRTGAFEESSLAGRSLRSGDFGDRLPLARSCHCLSEGRRDAQRGRFARPVLERSRPQRRERGVLRGRAEKRPA